MIAALLSMGLGIGANTAIFSLVDALLLRALPVERPGELVVARRRQLDQPDLGSAAGSAWPARRRRARLERRATRPLERRRDRSGRRADGERQLLRDARRAPGARPPADAGRRSARRRPRRPDDRDQRALLGAPLPARSRRRRPVADDQRRAVHDRRRRRRRASSARRSAARSTSRCRSARSIWSRPGGRQSALDGRSTWWLNVMLPPPAGPVDRRAPRRRCAACSRRSARRRCPDWPAEMLAQRYLAEPLTLEPAVDRPVRAAPALPRAAARAGRDRRARAARRLRQRRQPAAGPRRGAAARAGGPPGARRVARPAGPPAARPRACCSPCRARSPACCSPSGARASSSPRSAPPTSRWRSRCRSTGGCFGLHRRRSRC